jgi:hypothetical protein
MIKTEFTMFRVLGSGQTLFTPVFATERTVTSFEYHSLFGVRPFLTSFQDFYYIFRKWIFWGRDGHDRYAQFRTPTGVGSF